MENAYLSPPDSASYYSVARSLVLDGDIRFLDEYRAFGFEPNMFYLTKQDLLSNDWPVGSGIFWTPFLACAHGVAKVLGLVGVHASSVRADGYSALYQVFAVVGILLLAITGLLAGWSVVASWYGIWAAFAGTLMLLLGTPFGFYFYYYVFMAHITSFFAVTLFCAFWMWKAGEKRNLWEWSVLGVLAGWMTMIRPQNAVVTVVLLAEAYEVISAGFREDRPSYLRNYMAGLFILGLSALIAFLPQMMFWWRLYGNPVQMPKMEEMNWLTPRIDLMLFSTYHGLLAWSPVLLLVIPGLRFIYKENRIIGGGFTLVLLLQTYINGANEIWWAGGSFGNRRFVDYSLIFLLAFGACWKRWGKKIWFAAFSIFATIWNFALLAAERTQILTLDRHVSWDLDFLRKVSRLLLSPGQVFRALHGDFASASPVWRAMAVMVILAGGTAIYLFMQTVQRRAEVRRLCFVGAFGLVIGSIALMGMAVLKTSSIQVDSPETRSFIKALYNPEYGEVISRRNRLLWNNYYESGFYYLTKGNLNASADFYGKAKDLLPSHPSAYRYLGLINLEQGDFPAARTNLEKALEIRPQYEPAAQLLADVYRRILANEPYNQEVAAKLARLLAREKQYDAALQVAEYLLRINPENAGSRILVKEIEQAAERDKQGR